MWTYTEPFETHTHASPEVVPSVGDQCERCEETIATVESPDAWQYGELTYGWSDGRQS
jgi:hypothetical protein